MNPLLQTLCVIDYLPCSSADLEKHFSISSATLKRCIREARLLGAGIESVRSGKGWMYRLTNRSEIESLLKTWVHLEKVRDLRSGARASVRAG